MIFIAWHLGLGDAIVCTPIVAKLAGLNNMVTVPCYEHNRTSVESFFVNHENVTVVNEKQVPKLEIGDTVLTLGHYDKDMPQLPGEDFVEWFYRQAGMDISEKEKYCPIKEAVKKCDQLRLLRSKPVEYFIHDDKDRGFLIDKKNIPFNRTFVPINKKDSILQYAEILNSVKEIHCIDSSFLHLAEALGVESKKIYHKYARPESTEYSYLKGWEVINEKV